MNLKLLSTSTFMKGFQNLHFILFPFICITTLRVIITSNFQWRFITSNFPNSHSEFSLFSKTIIFSKYLNETPQNHIPYHYRKLRPLQNIAGGFSKHFKILTVNCCCWRQPLVIASNLLHAGFFLSYYFHPSMNTCFLGSQG